MWTPGRGLEGCGHPPRGTAGGQGSEGTRVPEPGEGPGAAGTLLSASGSRTVSQPPWGQAPQGTVCMGKYISEDAPWPQREEAPGQRGGRLSP